MQFDIASNLVRETYKPARKSMIASVTGRDPVNLRKAVLSARTFILDEKMSEFMAHLATSPFKVAQYRRAETLNSLRHSARLPFPSIFVQFDGRAFRRGMLSVAADTKDVWGEQLVPPDGDILPEVGWLIEEMPGDSECITVTEFFEWEGAVSTLPFCWIYRVDDKRFPTAAEGVPKHFMPDVYAGQFAHGIINYIDPSIAILYVNRRPFSPDQMMAVQQEGPNGEAIEWQCHRLVPEFGGVVRYVFALLATLNEVSVEQVPVKQKRTYTAAGGRERPFLEHTEMRLVLPHKTTYSAYAKRLIASARRGWHQVRPHFRTYARGVGPYCEEQQHLWPALDERGHAKCMRCNAWRTWIVLPNGRGDKSIATKEKTVFKVTHV